MLKEHPIIFSSEMIRAILEVSKTQTRRPMKVQPSHKFAIFADYKTDLGFAKSKESFWAGFWLNGTPDAGSPGYFKCPYGNIGDHLWVRETWAEAFNWTHDIDEERPMYRADCVEGKAIAVSGSEVRWKPSIHMPRSGSRITLEITDVRVERLQEISEKDAKAEGTIPRQMDVGSYLPSFEGIWDRIYEKTNFGWTQNPLVWVITFKKL